MSNQKIMNKYKNYVCINCGYTVTMIEKLLVFDCPKCQHATLKYNDGVNEK